MRAVKGNCKLLSFYVIQYKHRVWMSSWHKNSEQKKNPVTTKWPSFYEQINIS